MNNLYFLVFCPLLLLSPARAGEQSGDVCDRYTGHIEAAGKAAIEELRYKSGLLWKIEKQNSVNYLFGTMHSSDSAVSRLPPPVRVAIANSRNVLMETVPDEEANQIFNAMIYFDGTAGPDIGRVLPASVYSRLEAIMRDYQLESLDLSRLKPWAAFSLIGRPKPDNTPIQDMSIYEFARRHNKNVYPLETMDEILGALDSIALEDQIEILMDTVCNHSSIISDTAILTDLYLQGDLAGIHQFNNQPHHDEAVFARFLQIILHNRNQRIIERMQPWLDQGQTFMAVGALHLVGNTGLLQTLEKNDFNITRIY